MKLLPIGVDSFEKMINGEYYFVDKSLIIKDVRDFEGEVKLITRPRRFGKTLNMDMMKHFYAIDGKDLFDGLKIWEDEAFVKEHYHKYPVLFITFKEVRGSSWEEAAASLRLMLSDFVRQIMKKYLNDFEEDRDILVRLANGAHLSEYAYSPKIITRLLNEKYGKRVVFLIDEYDVPIEVAYLHQDEDPKYYRKMVDFMRGFLNAALKGNPHLEFAVITGVYRVAKESLFPSLNNVAVYSVLDNEMSDKFGFLEDEVYELLKYYNLEDDMKVVRDWYNGYTFGDVEGIYNPWSVIWYVKKRLSGKSVEQSLQPYWINSSGNDLIIHQIETNRDLQKDLDKLLSGQELKVRIDPFLSLREIDQYPHGVWTLLTFGGYLNATFAHNRRYGVSIPNKEVEEFYKTSVMNWIGKKMKVAMDDLLDALENALSQGCAQDFARLLERYLTNSLSYFDIGYDDAERVYKAFVLGMLSMAIDGYVVETEVESGYGRVDVAVYPKGKRFGKYALVMELKKAESEDELEKAAQQAFGQIQEKGYAAKYEGMGFEVIPIGMTFYGKKVSLAFRGCQR